MDISHTRHCIFCEIIHGAGEASVCYEDGLAIAFMDIQPVNPGHVLVVPREHFESLDDVPESLSLHLFQVAVRLTPVVRRLARAEAINVVVNSGAAAGQDVFHHHVHLIPRTANDGFDVPLPFEGSVMPDRTVLDAMAARIMCAMHDPVRRPSPVGHLVGAPA
jgi:histidine triad (HIT) family protein